MSARQYLFTSESVTEGHPDKIADQISDAVLDAVFSQDPFGRVACETLVTTGLAFIAGEITTRTYIEVPEIVRQTVREIGYDSSEIGFDYHWGVPSNHGDMAGVYVENHWVAGLNKQSPSQPSRALPFAPRDP